MALTLSEYATLYTIPNDEESLLFTLDAWAEMAADEFLADIPHPLPPTLPHDHEYTTTSPRTAATTTRRSTT